MRVSFIIYHWLTVDIDTRALGPNVNLVHLMLERGQALEVVQSCQHDVTCRR